MTIRKRMFLLFVAAILTLVAAAGCGSTTGADPGGADEGMLDIKGSDTMVNLTAAFAEAYMAEHENAEIVVQGGGSGTGIAALMNEDTDIAMSSRAMKDTEWSEAENLGIEVTEIVVGYDGVIVAVHPDNPVDALTVDQLGAIYRGEITNWSEVGGNDAGIVLLSRDTTSGTHVFFKEMVVQGDGADPSAEYSTDALFMPSTQAIVDETEQNANAIGYIGIGYFNPDTLQLVGIKTDESEVPVNPIDPHPDGLTYPLTRPLFFYVTGEYEGLVRDYVDFVLSADGQNIVRELDFIPVP